MFGGSDSSNDKELVTSVEECNEAKLLLLVVAEWLVVVAEWLVVVAE